MCETGGREREKERKEEKKKIGKESGSGKKTDARMRKGQRVCKREVGRRRTGRERARGG